MWPVLLLFLLLMDLQTFNGKIDAQDQLIDFLKQNFDSMGNKDENGNEKESNFCQPGFQTEKKYSESLLMWKCEWESVDSRFRNQKLFKQLMVTTAHWDLCCCSYQNAFLNALRGGRFLCFVNMDIWIFFQYCS